MANTLEHLSDRAVLRVLSEATSELGERLPVASNIRSAAEASAAIESLLRDATPPEGSATNVSLDSLGDVRIARALLAKMLEDPDVSPLVQAIVDDPPADTQKSVELAMAGAVILGGLIAWLQTSIVFEIDRKDGKTEFSFKLRKAASSNAVVQQAAAEVAKILTV